MYKYTLRDMIILVGDRIDEIGDRLESSWPGRILLGFLFLIALWVVVGVAFAG